MSQYINLLGPAFRKQRLLLNLPRALMLTGLALIAMVILQAYDQVRVDGLQQELTSAQGLLNAQSTYTDRLKGTAATPVASALDTEIRGLEMDLKAARDSIAVLESGALGNRDGFARYLQAFSRQIVDGLWLTGFSVGGAGDVLIQGRVLQPELVPAYIQKLNVEPALQGREFSTLELRRPQPAAASTAAPGTPQSGTPRFLEFSLSTGDPAAAVPGGQR